MYLVVVAILAVIIMYATDAPRRTEFEKLAPIVKKDLPYEKVHSILTPAERSFYEVLWAVARSEDLAVFTKVRLADLVEVRRGAGHRQALQNRIQQKHVDFVLCNTGRLAPVLVVELDDRSHQLPRRQEVGEVRLDKRRIVFVRLLGDVAPEEENGIFNVNKLSIKAL